MSRFKNIILSLMMILPIFIFTGCGETIECPDFVGKSYDIVTSGDRYDAFRFEVTYVESTEDNGGIILSQNVAPGTMLNKGDTIKLEVSKGLPKTTVPSVVGLSEAEAKERLEEAGFSVVFIYDASDDTQEGKCFTTSPKPETKHSIGGAVTVHISLGKDKKLVKYISIVGLSVEQATQKLSAIGLNVGRITYDEESELKQGTVISQFPKYNETIEIAKGSLVNITVAGKESEE